MSAVAFPGAQSPFSELACFRLEHDVWGALGHWLLCPADNTSLGAFLVASIHGLELEIMSF